MTYQEITNALCRMAAEAADELEEADTDFAEVEIKVSWPQEPYNQHGINFPVMTKRTAVWVAGEWKRETYVREVTLT